MSHLTVSESYRALDSQQAPPVPELQQCLYGAVLYPEASLLVALQHSDQIQYQSVNWEAAQRVPGVVKCVQRHHFFAVLASQESAAIQARDLIAIDWKVTPPNHEGFQGESYSWDSSLDNRPAWAVAHYDKNQLHVWLSTAYPQQLREELAVVTGLKPAQIHLYHCTTPLTEAYDVAIEAALLALEVSQPVYIKASTQLQVIRLAWPASTAQGNAWQSNVFSSLGTAVATSLLGWRLPTPTGIKVGTEYAPQIQTKAVEWVAPLGQQKEYATALTFAVESEFDEELRAQGEDPLQARLAHVQDERGKQVIYRAAQQAGWITPEGEIYTPQKTNHGYGFAYVKAVDHEQKPAQEVWSAWAVELRLDPEQRQLHLDKVTVAFDTDHYAQAEPTREHNVKHRIAQWTQQLLGLANTTPKAEGSAQSESSAPSLDLAQIQVSNQSPVLGQTLAWSKTAELPAAAAIANAVRDVTQVRLYHAPLDLSLAVQRLGDTEKRLQRTKKRWLWAGGGMMTALTSALLVAAPWRPAIPPVMNVDTSIFSSQAIERGRLVALAGDCMVCHTAEGGATNAGGLGLDTPFGTIYTTNITPDKETGIGAWSYKAFERAMREGIHQDGTHLYPAFPYTSYAQLSDEDLQSLYAYLMVQEPVKTQNKPNELAFPFSFRPALAGWNSLFHTERQAYSYNEDQSQLWNRGAYLVNSSGHCSACHTPRNFLGGEKKGQYFLAGGEADGWQAPALNALAQSPVPWTEDALFQYLRTGQSTQHGVAAGPMGPIIEGLSQLPEYDVRAMAHYLLNLEGSDSSQAVTMTAATQAVQQAEQSTQQREPDIWLMPGRTVYEGACAACHDSQAGPALFGSRPSLAVNSNIQSDNPDNLIQVIMHGITRPSASGLGNMPAFKHSLSDDQVVDLLQYLRARYAPQASIWSNLPEAVQKIRQQPGHL